jgi:hypothetical protein
MKKLLVASALALALTATSQQTASAWSEFKFSAGVNLGWVGGGNRILWGAYRSAPYPGGPDLGPYFPGLAAAYSGAGYAPYAGYAAYDAPYGGHPVPHADAGPAAHPAAPAGQMPAVTGVPHSYNPYFNTGYQPVGYAYPGYAASQVPGYWYGR